MASWIEGRETAWMYRRTDERMDGWADRQMDGRMGGQTDSSCAPQDFVPFGAAVLLLFHTTQAGHGFR